MGVAATLKWTDDMQFVGRVGDGPGVILDNPQGGSGPTPMQMVLMGVAGCTGMDVVSILKKKRSSFSALEVNIEGEQAENHPRRYTTIKIEFLVYGKNVKTGDVERSIDLSISKYCSAIATLNAEVVTSFKILES